MKKDSKAPQSLQNRIHSFGLGIVLILGIAGILLGAVSIQITRSYQAALSQITDIRQLRSDIVNISKSVQDFVVNGEDNRTEGLAAWQALSQKINTTDVKMNEQTSLLMSDLRAYQKNTEDSVYRLLQITEADNLTERYQLFLSQQEDRLFLCDLLQAELIEQIANQYPAIASKQLTYVLLFSISLFCLISLTGMFSATFAHDVYQPVQKLVEHAQEMMVGNYDEQDMEVVQEDEIGHLTAAFNEMKHQIQKNFRNQEELWRMETMVQDAELKALQSQINPHFLFNVLSVATEAALLENADHTVDVIENISYMLHYGLTSVRDDALLSDELKMVRSYVFLQQKRFGDRITFTMDIPDALPLTHIPGMTLQPIVENAVMHGVEKMPTGGLVRISVLCEHDCVRIRVSDNGLGMSQKMTAALNRGEIIQSGSHSTGLGVANVRSRMEAFYGKSGLLLIESKEQVGTRATLTYLTKEDAGDDSGLDCG